MSFSIYLFSGRAKEQVTIKNLSHIQASNLFILNNSHSLMGQLFNLQLMGKNIFIKY